MAMNSRLLIVRLGIAFAASAAVNPALAQQSKSNGPATRPGSPAATSKSSPAQGNKPALTAGGKSAAPSVRTVESPEKNAILNSSRWRRAMFEMNEWLLTQPFYNKEQVEDLKSRLAANVARASASDLQSMLDDMETKFQILDNQQAQEARAWMAHYLSVVTQKKRDEMLKELPNLATMSAAELQQEVTKIERKRAASARNQAAFDQARQAQVDSQLKQNQAAQEAYTREQNLAATSAYTSPYRPPAANDGKPPFSDYKEGPQMEYYIGAFGRFGLIFNPSSY
jgi:hypothetical protein